MTDDDPLDLAQVAADEAALADLRRAGRDANDPVLLLLRDLLDDVSEQEVPQPVSCGSTVLALAGDRSPERRGARNGVLVAALTAGLLSVSGVAAAATLAPSGTPLHGLGEAVRSAVGVAVTAVTPPDRVVPAAPVVPPPTTVVPEQAPPPGAEVSAAARSAAAARKVVALLDAAEALLRDGRTAAASARLDAAESRLIDVAAAEAEPLATRLGELREQVEAAAAAETERQGPKEPAAEPGPPREDKPSKAGKGDKAEKPDDAEKPAKAGKPAKAEKPDTDEPASTEPAEGELDRVEKSKAPKA